MTCRRCRKKFDEFETRCPHCGETNDHVAGMFQTSSVLISTSGTERVYRSVEEVPAALRTRLLKSTNGANSATILIADRRGRKEIAKAMRNLPGPTQRRWMQAILGPEAASTAMNWRNIPCICGNVEALPMKRMFRQWFGMPFTQ